MRALAFDISIRGTGWAFGSTDMKRPLWGDRAIAKNDWSPKKDIHTIAFRDLARSLIEANKPNLIIYEQPFVTQETLDFAFTEAQCSMISQLWVLKHDLKVPRLAQVMPNVWQRRVTGRDKAPADLGNNKGARREFWKDQAMKVCRDRDWFVTTQNEADACCIMLYALTMTDKVFASREGPLFRRAQMQADRERMVK